MNPEVRPPTDLLDSHRLSRWPFSLAVTLTWTMALLLLGAATIIILGFRSPKYVVAVILAAAGAAASLAIPRKQYYLVFAVGFSLPYYTQVILIERSVLLSITGTFLLTVALALICLAAGRMRREGLALTPAISVPALILMAAGFLSSLNTADKTDTFIALAQQLEMLFLFLVLVNAIREEAYLVNFLRGLYLGFAIQCGIYVIQNILGISFEVVGNAEFVGTTDLGAGRIVSHRGTFGATPAIAALYFSVFTMFLVGVFLCRKRLPIRLHPVLGMVMGAGCLFLAAKRAPLGGFVIGMALMCLLILRYSTQSMGRLTRLLAVLAVPVLVLLPILLLRAEAKHDKAWEERFNLNRVAWNMVDAHPILGVGLGTYDGVKRSYMPEDWSGWLSKVHNRYMMILAESGIVGLSAFVFLFLMALATAYRGIGAIDPSYRPLQIALVCGLVAVLWEMFWDVFDHKAQGYITWILVALSVVLPRVLSQSTRQESV